MRVINNKDTFEFNCPHCNSTLGITKGDISYSYVFGHDSYYYCICGACDRVIRFGSRSAFPHHWQPRLEAIQRNAMGDDYD